MTTAIKKDPLQKTAFVYLRQSSPTQVKKNVEGSRRQREMADRMKQLGWPAARIRLLGGDTGNSGSTLHGRDDYQAIVEAVLAGQAGAVAARELSRLVRDNQDWNQLVRLCRHQDVLLYPVAELGRLPEGQRKSGVGYLGSAAAFEPVWAVFKPGEALPAVDFGKNVVVFHRNVDFYNRTRIFKVTLEDGVAEVLAMETMSATPVADKVAMAMAVIPRAGVKSLRAGPANVALRAE